VRQEISAKRLKAWQDYHKAVTRQVFWTSKIKGIGLWEQRITIVIQKREPAYRILNVKNFNK
jgi:hypothetical protein